MADYDYVIVGAGSAGCALANRLSADPSVRVLLLEAGGSDRNLNIRIPVGFAKQFRTDLDWGYSSEPEPNLIGRSMYLPRGRSLGGSSSMNAMIYLRGHRTDFDGWAANGAPGWSYAEVLPVLQALGAQRAHPRRVPRPGRRAERRRPDLDEHADRAVRGVGRGRRHRPQRRLQRRRAGRRRADAGDAEARPPLERRRRVPAPGPQAARQPDGRHQGPRAPRAARGRARGRRRVRVREGGTETARAEREVIVSAGAYNSPQLLMLSGIGPADHLREVGVDVAVDSPHVGQHLQDHSMSTLT